MSISKGRKQGASGPPEEGPQKAGGPQNWKDEPPPSPEQLEYERDPTPDPDRQPDPTGQRREVRSAIPADPIAVRMGRLKSEMKVYCFDGKLAQAPDWIDKNWAGFENDQNERGQGYAGPTLRVHDMNYEEGVLEGAGGVEPVFIGVARVGDYIVREDVELGDGTKVVGKVKIVEASEAKRLGLVH